MIYLTNHVSRILHFVDNHFKVSHASVLIQKYITNIGLTTSPFKHIANGYYKVLNRYRYKIGGTFSPHNKIEF